MSQVNCNTGVAAQEEECVVCYEACGLKTPCCDQPLCNGCAEKIAKRHDEPSCPNCRELFKTPMNNIVRDRDRVTEDIIYTEKALENLSKYLICIENARDVGAFPNDVYKAVVSNQSRNVIFYNKQLEQLMNVAVNIQIDYNNWMEKCKYTNYKIVDWKWELPSHTCELIMERGNMRSI